MSSKLWLVRSWVIVCLNFLIKKNVLYRIAKEKYDGLSMLSPMTGTEDTYWVCFILVAFLVRDKCKITIINQIINAHTWLSLNVKVPGVTVLPAGLSHTRVLKNTLRCTGVKGQNEPELGVVCHQWWRCCRELSL